MKNSMMTSNKTIRACASIALFLLAATRTWAEAVPAGQLGCDAPPLEGLEWVKGDPIEKMQTGSVYVIEFWATWCGPCIQGIPHLTELQKAYQDKKVTVIGISNETNGKVPPFVKKKGDEMAYTVAIDAEGKMSEGYMKAFKQGGIPHAFIIDQEGRIAWRGHPMTMDEPLEQIVSGNYDMAETVKKMAEEEREEERARAAYQAKRDAQEKKITTISARIENDPKNVQLLVERAQAHLGDSFTSELSYRPADLPKSIADYKKALALDPADPYHVAQHLAFLEAWEDRTDGRIAKLKAFADTYPDSIRAPFATFSLYYDANENGDKERAMQYLNRTADTVPEGRFGSSIRRMREEAVKAAR